MVESLITFLILFIFLFLIQRKTASDSELELKVQRLRADYLLLNESARLEQYRLWLQQYAELSHERQKRRDKKYDAYIERDKKLIGKGINAVTERVNSLTSGLTIEAHTYNEGQLRIVSRLLGMIAPPKGIRAEEKKVNFG